MKKIYLLFFAVIIVSNAVFAQVGNPDSSFGTNGQLITDVSNQHDYLSDGILQSDGKIIAAGSSGYPLQNTLVRYKTNGRIDQSFGINGISTYKFNNRDAEINAVATQTDGKIVATGYGEVYNQDTSLYYTTLTIMRFNKNGSIDSSFGNNGIVIKFINQTDIRSNAIAIQPDGKIVVAGQVDQRNKAGNKAFVSRYTANGQPDISFNGNGIKTFAVDEYTSAVSVAVLPGNKILVGGASFISANDTLKFMVAKFTASGQADASFGNNGIAASTGFSKQPYSNVYSMSVQANGKIILGGSLFGYGINQDFALIRFSKDGFIDSGFGTNGLTTTDFRQNEYVFSVAIQADGKIIAAGESDVLGGGNRPAYFALARYNINGKVDSTFGNHGKVATSFENFGNRQFSYAQKVLLQPDDKIIALGNADVKLTGKNVFALARYLNDGSSIAQNNKPTSPPINIKISPNPVYNSMYISGLNSNFRSILTITDRAGNAFKKVAATNSNYTWNIADLKSGLYYLVVENGSDKTSVSFIKR